MTEIDKRARRALPVGVQTAKIYEFPARYQGGERWEPWLGERDIARHFGVSERTVRRWRLEGCPSARFGGARRFRLSAVESWQVERSAS